MEGYKNPLASIIDVISGSGTVTIENNPGTMAELPKGAPVELVSGLEWKLIKGLELYEAVTAGTDAKVKKMNLLGVGDTIAFSTPRDVVSIDYSNADYDLVTFDGTVTAVLNVYYSESFTKASVTTVNTKIKPETNSAHVGILLSGEFKVGLMNLKAPLTEAKVLKGITISNYM